MKKCSQTQPRWCITRAILLYRLDTGQAAWMRRIPGCESGFNPYAYYGNPFNRAPVTALVYRGGISAGLYEFKPDTWDSTPYGRRYGRDAIWLAKWQSLAAAWMVRAGQEGQWVCR